MPQKKQTRNAFSFFMLDYKKKHEALGVKFPGGLKDVANACSAEWNRLTPQQKGPYVAKAKNAKVQDGINGERYTTEGTPLSFIEQIKRRKQEFEDNMNDYIKLAVDLSEGCDRLLQKKFYFIHVNRYCCKQCMDGTSDFYPAEFAIAEFSLRHGVQKTYHEIIDIDLPLGYAADIKEYSNLTHKISRNPPGGQKNFSIMYEQLRKFLEPETIGAELPPLYTAKAVREVVPGLLSRMAVTAGQTVDIFRIYSLETLFFHIRNAAATINNSTGFPVLTLAAEEIQKDVFDYTPGIACDYHSSIDGTTVHCSLSIVIRWAYTICDYCCIDLDIDMQPGFHCPIDTDFIAIKRTKAELESKDICQLADQAEVSLSFADMTGVTLEHRLRTSERTYREEQARRQTGRPLQIIDHSKIRSSNLQEIESAPPRATTNSHSVSAVTRKPQRPLRLPYSMSLAMKGVGSDQLPAMNEMNFPSIGGRGGVLKNLSNEFPSVPGRGRANSLGN
ncbi:protein maelstrom homolog isoform X2 [Athalia rosae]|uniref:protein maelstrom homolog isoform X2 n=1 Tax=Athalia rosae TaxID=37344 RepID=UPI00203323CB|nr:protein maelstrom homolog isoform X2 [Athalia rosae]